MGSNEFSKTESFLKYSFIERVAYLLKFKYYNGLQYENNYFEFIKENNINKARIYKMECLINSVYPYDILGDIIKNGYCLQSIDLNDYFKVRTIYNMLFMFMEDIKRLDNIPSYLVDIYRLLENNMNIVKTNYLASVGEIFDNMSDPFMNDEFLKGCLYKLEHGNSGNSYITSSVFIKGDTFPKEERISEKDDINFLASYMYDIIRKYIEINKLPGKQKEKYNCHVFISEQGIKELEELSLDDYKRIIMLYNKRSSMEVNGLLKEMFPSKDDSFYRTLIIGSNVRKWNDDHYGGIEYSNRVYLYCGHDSQSKRLFFKSFVLKCIDNGIGYNTKTDAGGDFRRTKDSSVIYVRTAEELPVVFRILDEIKMEHPEWINDFGSPLWGCGQYKDSYYSIGYMGRVKANHGYVTDSNGKREYYLSPNAYTYNGAMDEYLKDAYKLLMEKINKSKITLSESEKIELFRRILYKVKEAKQREYLRDTPEIGRRILSRGDKLNVSFQAVVDMYSDDMPVHRNAACDVLTDCYIQYEMKKIDLIDSLYSERNMDNILEVNNGRRL